MSVHDLAERIEDEREAYAHGEARPIGSYGVILGIYAVMVGALTFLVRRRRAPLPVRPAAADVALLGIATYRLSRLVTKDSVTAVLRAPFTQFEEAAGEGEVNESVRGTGWHHAVGELLSCPFCVAQWVATAFAFGLVLAPRATRLAATVLTAVTASDWLQFAHSALQRNEQES